MPACERRGAIWSGGMDADDVCEPHRFERQVAYLQENPECVAAGSWVRLIDPYGLELNEVRPATDHEQIDAHLLEANGWAIFHPTVMLRREAVLQSGGYRSQYQWSEDIDLFLRLAEIGRLANLPQVLLRYRQHMSSVNRTRRATQMAVNRRLMQETYTAPWAGLAARGTCRWSIPSPPSSSWPGDGAGRHWPTATGKSPAVTPWPHSSTAPSNITPGPSLTARSGTRAERGMTERLGGSYLDCLRMVMSNSFMRRSPRPRAR